MPNVGVAARTLLDGDDAKIANGNRCVSKELRKQPR